MAETEAVATTDDAADDAAVWVDPVDPSKSLIIWTDKKTGLVVSDLSGTTLQRLAPSRPNNVDVAQHAGFEGLVFSSDRADNSIRAFRVDPATRNLVAEPTATIATGLDEVYGLCAYFDTQRGGPTVIVGSKSGTVQTYELQGSIGAWNHNKTRTFHVGGQAEGFAVDQDLGFLYVGEEQVGVWQYPLAPSSEQPRRLVDIVRPDPYGPKGNLVPDVEGITLYDAGDRRGWLIVSCQSEDRFAVYDRETLAFLGSFALTLARADGSVDRVTHTDGIHATATPLGPGFPRGIFIAQDDNNGSAQNFKLASWSAIADVMSLKASAPLNADPSH